VRKISHIGGCLLRGKVDVKGDKRNTYKMLFGNSEWKNHSEGLEKDGSPFSQQHILVMGEFKVITGLVTLALTKPNITLKQSLKLIATYITLLIHFVKLC
jgi:hypothetical protein